MKKYSFYSVLIATTLVGGALFTSCSDDDDDTKDPVLGVKTFELTVLDDKGAPASADLVIKQEGAAEQTVSATNGSYVFDVSEMASQTNFSFQATRNGYISSDVTEGELVYTNPEDAFSSALTLYITKKGDPVTIDPTKATLLGLLSSSSPGSEVSINIPAGAMGTSTATLTPTVIPTPASYGILAVNKVSNSFALEIYDFESSWTGDFANGEKVEFTFPLTQNVVDLVNGGMQLQFGTDSRGTWEAYPVTVNVAAKTGTVEIPHFSSWVLSPTLTVTERTTETPFVEVATGQCGESLTATVSETNPAFPEFYQKLFSRESFPGANNSKTFPFLVNNLLVVSAKYMQKTLTTSDNSIPVFSYFTGPVDFSVSYVECTHSGGSGS